MENFMERKGKTMIVYIPAEVDHDFADKVKDSIDRVIQTEDVQRLVFDFKNTEFMDSSGIGMLMGRYKLIHALGGEVKAKNVGKQIFRILTLSGIHKIMKIEEAK